MEREDILRNKEKNGNIEKKEKKERVRKRKSER